MATQTPWAVLLCKFKDRPQDPPVPRDTFEKLFTTKGHGLFNMTRFFAENSHGVVDLLGSQVFGWLTIDALHNAYTPPSEPPPPGWMQTLGRNELVRRAQTAALAAGVPLANFYGVVLTFNVAIGGAFGGVFQAPMPRAAVGDYRYVANNGSQAFGQEMGHAYGLNHSRVDNSLDDYRDPWDTMSTGAAFSGRDPDFGMRGPGLNAANMRYMNWLDASRVWRVPNVRAVVDEVVTLRPLHRHDLPGFLAAELPPYGGTSQSGLLVELRIREGWDSGIPRPAILVHQLRQGYSYLLAGTQGQLDLVKGGKFQLGGGVPWGPFSAVEVLDIDEAGRSARIRLQSRPAELPHFEIVSRIVGAVGADGGGVVIGPGGVSPVGPWDPMAGVLKHIAALRAAELIPDTHLRLAVKRGELSEMARIMAEAIAEIDSFGAPAPPHLLKAWRMPGTRKGRARAPAAKVATRKRRSL